MKSKNLINKKRGNCTCKLLFYTLIFDSVVHTLDESPAARDNHRNLVLDELSTKKRKTTV